MPPRVNGQSGSPVRGSPGSHSFPTDFAAANAVCRPDLTATNRNLLQQAESSPATSCNELRKARERRDKPVRADVRARSRLRPGLRTARFPCPAGTNAAARTPVPSGGRASASRPNARAWQRDSPLAAMNPPVVNPVPRDSPSTVGFSKAGLESPPLAHHRDGTRSGPTRLPTSNPGVVDVVSRVPEDERLCRRRPRVVT